MQPVGPQQHSPPPPSSSQDHTSVHNTALVSQPTTGAPEKTHTNNKHTQKTKKNTHKNNNNNTHTHTSKARLLHLECFWYILSYFLPRTEPARPLLKRHNSHPAAAAACCCAQAFHSHSLSMKMLVAEPATPELRPSGTSQVLHRSPQPWGRKAACATPEPMSVLSLDCAESDDDDGITSEQVSRCTSPGVDALNPLVLGCPFFSPSSLAKRVQASAAAAAAASAAASASAAPTFQAAVEDALARPSALLTPVDDDCVSGTYILKTRPGSAVVKPAALEAAARLNPKGHTSGAKEGFAPEHGYLREVFAAEVGAFAGVPETVEVAVPGRLLGLSAAGGDEAASYTASAQAFVPGCSQSWDSGPGGYSTEDVHRIGILDLRLLNCDRHGGNILVKDSVRDAEGKRRLVPIDHGYTLPTHIADLDYEWQHWPQSKKAFSDELLAYVAAIDVEAEVAAAERCGIEADAIALFKAATLVVQIGCAQGLTLSELAAFFRRERVTEESGLEMLCSECRHGLDETPESGLIDFDLLTTRAAEVYAKHRKPTPLPSLPSLPHFITNTPSMKHRICKDWRVALQ